MTAFPLLRRSVNRSMARVAGEQRWANWRSRYHRARNRVADRAENIAWRVAPPLIVIESEPRRRQHFYGHFLEWLSRERPSLRSHVHLGRLPGRLPGGARLLHAWVPDPVAERAPQVYAQLTSFEREAARQHVPVVHPARVLSNSKRDVACERLTGVGLRTPRVAVVDAGFDRHRGGLQLPMVVRRRWGHGGDVRRLDTEPLFEAWWAEVRTEPGSWVAVEYLDVRSADGLYRKYRYLMAGSRGAPRHLIVSPRWEVRPADRVRTPSTRDEELAFVESPCPHHARFDAARQALEFEIVAFDYSYDVKGSLVVWEGNPYPDLSPPKGEVGKYLAATVDRSYGILADYYAERARIHEADGPSSGWRLQTFQ
jgi:hypothetical protein